VSYALYENRTHGEEKNRVAGGPRKSESVLTTSTFADLGVAQEICDALDSAGITSPFPIQSMCIPLALDGQDLIGQAKTGTGKTLGFGIPLLQKLDPTHSNRTPHALVVVPTRELCVQVAKDLEVAGKRQGSRVLSVYGGRSYEPQVEALEKGIDVVVGTPGRLMDLARQRKLILSDIKILVLDEADEMLDMGFLPDVEAIVAMLPTNRQTLLFSATMPGQIVNLARRYMTSPTHIRASDPSDDNVTVESIEQHVWRAHSMDKPEIIARVLQAKDRGLVIIFCRTKRNAQKLTDDLQDRGFAVGSVHGDLGQGAREQALRAFRSGKIDVLVATDVAARGIDVEGVTHVINYTCPEDEKTYLHRIGRTGRAGASGVAVTLVDWDDIPRWGLINKALGLAFHEPIETYSTSAHVYTGLGIPEGTTGRLPKASRTRAGLDAEKIEDLGETGAAAGRRNKPRSSGSSTRSGSGSGSKSASKPRAKQASDHGSGATSDGKPKRKRNRRRSRSGKPVADAANSANSAANDQS
jgi:superfamily II DNA/RNA helicase